MSGFISTVAHGLEHGLRLGVVPTIAVSPSRLILPAESSGDDRPGLRYWKLMRLPLPPKDSAHLLNVLSDQPLM